MQKQDKSYEEELGSVIDAFLGHEKHLAILEQCYEELYSLSNKLNPGESDVLKYTIKKLQIQYILKAIAEINKCIVASLKWQCFTVSEALSRIAIEHSVNLMFVLDGEEHDRSKSFLKHYIVKSKEKAQKWLDYSNKSNDHGAIEAAKSKISYLEILSNNNKGLVGKDVKGWKDARQRFAEVGVEKLYHVLFASSSDSIHSLSEDIFNLTIIETQHESMGRIAYKGFLAEKLSFAYYLSANSLSFFAEALHRLACYMGENAIANEAVVTGEKLVKVIKEHNETEKVN